MHTLTSISGNCMTARPEPSSTISTWSVSGSGIRNENASDQISAADASSLASPARSAMSCSAASRGKNPSHASAVIRLRSSFLSTGFSTLRSSNNRSCIFLMTAKSASSSAKPRRRCAHKS